MTAPLVQLRSPSKRLSRFVSRIRVWKSAPGQSRQVERLPDGSSVLMFRATRATGDSFIEGDLSVAGPRSRAQFKTAPATPLCISFEFHPGAAYPFFGLPIDALTDNVVLVRELWGPEGERTTDAALRAVDADSAIAVVEAALLRRLGADALFEPVAARGALWVMRRLEAAAAQGDSLRVDELAASVGLSARQLRRVFPEVVGVSARRFARMRRFHHAVERIATVGPAWAEVLDHAGYYDQAHLASEFRSLAGMSPGAFARRHVRAAALFRPCEPVNHRRMPEPGTAHHETPRVLRIPAPEVVPRAAQGGHAETSLAGSRRTDQEMETGSHSCESCRS